MGLVAKDLYICCNPSPNPANLKEEMTRKVAQNVAEIQEQRGDITEAQARVAELEEWNVDAKEANLTLLEQQTGLQEKPTEVESHGRRCNAGCGGSTTYLKRTTNLCQNWWRGSSAGSSRYRRGLNFTFDGHTEALERNRHQEHPRGPLWSTF